MAGLEHGNQCFCGNFLNGTQRLGDELCQTPCESYGIDIAGTVNGEEACGRDWALACYSPDSEARGWGSIP